MGHGKFRGRFGSDRYKGEDDEVEQQTLLRLTFT